MRLQTRFLAATVGALLLSVSHPALSQENDGRLMQSEPQQVEDSQQGEPQPAEQAEMQPPAMPEPWTEQAEVQPPTTPEPQIEQAEMPQPAMTEPQTEQAEMQPPATPEPQIEQVEIQPPAMQPPQTEQAEMPAPATPQPQTEQAAVQQPEMQQPAMPEPQPQEAAIQQPATPEPATQGVAQDIALPRDARWTVFVEPSLGTRMDLPSAVFTMPDGAAYRGVGRQFKTADGRAALAIYSQRNNQRDTPASYLRKNFSFPRTTVTYERITRDFFAVSGVREDKIFYSRCNVSPSGGTLHCFDLQFPTAERTDWDAIVTRMSRSLRPLNRS